MTAYSEPQCMIRLTEIFLTQSLAHADRGCSLKRVYRLEHWRIYWILKADMWWYLNRGSLKFPQERIGCPYNQKSPITMNYTPLIPNVLHPVGELKWGFIEKPSVSIPKHFLTVCGLPVVHSIRRHYERLLGNKTGKEALRCVLVLLYVCPTTAH